MNSLFESAFLLDTCITRGYQYSAIFEPLFDIRTERFPPRSIIEHANARIQVPAPAECPAALEPRDGGRDGRSCDGPVCSLHQALAGAPAVRADPVPGAARGRPVRQHRQYRRHRDRSERRRAARRQRDAEEHARCRCRNSTPSPTAKACTALRSCRPAATRCTSCCPASSRCRATTCRSAPASPRNWT